MKNVYTMTTMDNEDDSFRVAVFGVFGTRAFSYVLKEDEEEEEVRTASSPVLVKVEKENISNVSCEYGPEILLKRLWCFRVQ